MKAVINSKADTSLSNLASVAINTHLLPGTDEAVDLGSGAKRYGNIFMSGSIATPVTIATGSLTTNVLKVGVNGATIDTIKSTGTAFQVFDNGVQLSPDIPPSGYDALDDYAKLLVDTTGIFVFGAGSGTAADSTLFAINSKAFGSFYNYTDTLYVVNFNVLYLTSGDSLRFNCYYGNRMTGVATDSLFNAIQPVGVNQNILTPNDRKIPPDKDVWIKMSGTQLTGLRPKQFEIQLNGYIIRDH